jgi:predicted DNA-binding transcriptional regulator YafY
MVRFRASGMKELAWHLFTWGDNLRILAPQSLKDAMLTALELALACHSQDAASETDASGVQTPSS